jgi:hypothetical protein
MRNKQGPKILGAQQCAVADLSGSTQISILRSHLSGEKNHRPCKFGVEILGAQQCAVADLSGSTQISILRSHRLELAGVNEHLSAVVTAVPENLETEVFFFAHTEI